jgi:hypothetical protein
MVQAAGLAGQARPSMGRIDARFADWRIGACSHVAQLWVDRTVALDYTLKSLEKILDGDPREHVHAARVVIRDAAFTVLERMCGLIAACPETAGGRLGAGGHWTPSSLPCSISNSPSSGRAWLLCMAAERPGTLPCAASVAGGHGAQGSP